MTLGPPRQEVFEEQLARAVETVVGDGSFSPEMAELRNYLGQGHSLPGMFMDPAYEGLRDTLATLVANHGNTTHVDYHNNEMLGDEIVNAFATHVPEAVPSAQPHVTIPQGQVRTVSSEPASEPRIKFSTADNEFVIGPIRGKIHDPEFRGRVAEGVKDRLPDNAVDIAKGAGKAAGIGFVTISSFLMVAIGTLAYASMQDQVQPQKGRA